MKRAEALFLLQRSRANECKSPVNFEAVLSSLYNLSILSLSRVGTSYLLCDLRFGCRVDA